MADNIEMDLIRGFLTKILCANVSRNVSKRISDQANAIVANTE